MQKEKICIFSRLLVTSSYVFFVITLEPNEVQTCSAPQNNCLNLIFVKSFFVNSRKLARNGWKTCIYYFVSSQVQSVFCHNSWTKWGSDLRPQNNRLNLVFVKGIYVDGWKLARNGRKTAILAIGSGQWYLHHFP